MEGIEALTDALAPKGLGAPSRRHFDARAYQLSMQWPSLAAALALLLAENGIPVPGPFRHAKTVIEQEKRK